MARGKRGTFPNGRNKTSGPFVKIDHYIFDCQAYRTMKPGPRALLWELIRRYNGTNNGAIGLGVREAAISLEMTDKDTLASYFTELTNRGFIKASRKGGFNMKDPEARRATEWILTWERHGSNVPTKEFLKWMPDA